MWNRLLPLLLFAMLTTACSHVGIVTVMEGFPSVEKGYEQGVSACYATCLGNELVMAGGANFAEKPAAEGGKKCYYKGIYAAEITNGNTLQWHKIGELPQPMAYGTTVCSGNEMIVIGGMNAEGGISSVYAISIVDGKAQIKVLPSLPMTMNDTAGFIDSGMIYVGGGKSEGRETKAVFCLNLNSKEAGWQEVTAFDGNAAVQSVAFMQNGKPAFMGGFTTSPEAFVYEGPSGGALATTDNGRIYVAGGVNHDIFLDAISGRYELVDKADYMLKDPDWYKFDGRLRLYDPQKHTFKTIATDKNLARAGASLVAYGNKYLFSIGGEIKPGIRSAIVTRCKIK